MMHRLRAVGDIEKSSAPGESSLLSGIILNTRNRPILQLDYRRQQ